MTREKTMLRSSMRKSFKISRPDWTSRSKIELIRKTNQSKEANQLNFFQKRRTTKQFMSHSRLM